MKKKGFTLIELLAVIVILAIIALILVPKISDLILNIRKQAFIQSLNGIMQSASLYVDAKVLENTNITYPIVFTCDGTACVDGDNTQLVFKGEIPVSGTITISEGVVVAGEVCNKEFCGSGTKGSLFVDAAGVSIAPNVFEYNGEYGPDGSVQTYVIPKTGTYKLEVWGASGGGNGYGGYQYGFIRLNEGEKLAVVVGGMGTYKENVPGTSRGQGGFNGGGNGAWGGQGGGGATNIAKYDANYTTLDSYINYETASNYVYVIGAGGGGGPLGGLGGGTTGGNGDTSSSSNADQGYGAGLASGGIENPHYSPCGAAGTFGKGGSTCRDSYSNGGGGGFYGGSASYSGYGSGGGGSSYSSPYVIKAATIPGVREGHGRAIITYVRKAELSAGATYLFNYKGSTTPDYSEGEIQSFIVPETGIYKLEVWGASGGSYNDTYHGGYGAYAKGNIRLTEGTNLYVAVGGQGYYIGPNQTGKGGYNGGGSVIEYWSDANEKRSTGGGATSIVETLIGDGQLKNYASDQDKVLIVAGGGGGVQVNTAILGRSHSVAGSGGGYVGGAGYAYDSGAWNVPGGTQISAGTYASFGQGGTATKDVESKPGVVSGGGGGFYGGGAAWRGASGGSGHLHADMFDGVMYGYDAIEDIGESNQYTISTTGDNKDEVNCPNGYSNEVIRNCAKKGNGYAVITYLGKN